MAAAPPERGSERDSKRVWKKRGERYMVLVAGVRSAVCNKNKLKCYKYNNNNNRSNNKGAGCARHAAALLARFHCCPSEAVCVGEGDRADRMAVDSK